MSGNTLYYPAGLNITECKNVFVKYTVDVGMAQVIEVIDSKYGYAIRAWCPKKKEYVTLIKKKKIH